MTRPEDDAVEFRAGTLNDLLEAAKGGRPQATADVQRLRSLAIGGGVSSALLAVALVVILITGGGGKGNAEATGSTTTTVAPLPAPPGTRTTKVSLADSRVPSGVDRGAKIGLTDGQAIVDDVVVLAVNRETTQIAGTSSTRVILDIAVNTGSFATFTQLNKQTLQAFGGVGASTPSSTPSPSS